MKDSCRRSAAGFPKGQVSSGKYRWISDPKGLLSAKMKKRGPQARTYDCTRPWRRLIEASRFQHGLIAAHVVAWKESHHRGNRQYRVNTQHSL